MKKSTLLVTLVAILAIFTFVSCSNEVTPKVEDKLGFITFDENSKAVTTVIKYTDEVEDMYWYYTAQKVDDGFTTGSTNGTLTAVSNTGTDNTDKGLSGKTLGTTGFSYGLWNIELKGYKEKGATSGSPIYTATLTNFLVNANKNNASAEIKIGDGAETKIVFDTTDGISFSSSNIKSTSVFTLVVTDSKGTVVVGTGSGDIEKAEGSVKFKNLTYTPTAEDITGDHTMVFTLKQSLVNSDSTNKTQNVEIQAATYTLNFKVIKGTTTTISGTLTKTDTTGEITIDSVQNLEEITMTRAIDVNDIDETNNVAKASKKTTLQYGTMTIEIPVGTVIDISEKNNTQSYTEEDSAAKTGTADAPVGFYEKENPTSSITIDSENEGSKTYELKLPVSTNETDTNKKNTTLVTVTNFVGKNKNITSILHNGAAMNKLTTAPSDTGFSAPTNESYYYNAQTGFLTLYVFHASEIAIVERQPVAIVGGEEKYYLSDAISALGDATELTLLRNVAVDQKNSANEDITISKNLTLDLAGNTVTIKAGSISLGSDVVVTVENCNAEQKVFIKAVEVKDKTGVSRTYYSTLEAALEAANEGDTVTLGASVTLTEDITVSKSITLDLNGQTLTPGGKTITVSSGILTVTGKADSQAEFVTGVFTKAETETSINGTYAPRVAKIGENYYASLAAAVAAADANATVELLCDITLTEPVVVTKNITLDLGNKVITATESNKVFVNAGTLTVSGKTETQTDFVYGVKGDGDTETYTARVAQIGNDTYYASLEDAIEAASDGDTIVLLQNVEMTKKCEVLKNLIIDLNSKTLSINNVSPFISVGVSDNESEITINDSDKYEVIFRNGIIDSDRTNLNSSGHAMIFSVSGGSKLCFDSVTIKDVTQNGGATIFVCNYSCQSGCSSEVVLKNTTINNPYGQEIIFGIEANEEPVVIRIYDSQLTAEANNSVAVLTEGYATIDIKGATVVANTAGVSAECHSSNGLPNFGRKTSQTINIKNTTLQTVNAEKTTTYPLQVMTIGETTVELQEVTFKKAASTVTGDMEVCLVAFCVQNYTPADLTESVIKVTGNSASTDLVKKWLASGCGGTYYYGDTKVEEPTGE